MTPAEAWRQNKTPVIYMTDRMLVRLPYSTRNRALLTKSRCRDPAWDQTKKLWRLPKSRFEDLVDSLARQFGSVHVIQRSNGHKCAAACWHAECHLCECSCGGRFHGQGRPAGNWAEVNDALAVGAGELFLQTFVPNGNGGIVTVRPQ